MISDQAIEAITKQLWSPMLYFIDYADNNISRVCPCNCISYSNYNKSAVIDNYYDSNGILKLNCVIVSIYDMFDSHEEALASFVVRKLAG